MKRVGVLGLAMLLLASLITPCLAAGESELSPSPRYAYIGINSVYLTINETTGVAQCSADCLTDDPYNVEVVCKLQKYAGGYYSTVKTWSDSGISYACAYGEWAVYSGYTYRLYATFYVRDSNGNMLEIASSSDSYVYPKQ